ncbi:MAG: hypothetical protein KC583_03455 [Myxococcales bacterium]|nr:hypothetical protein [Myxococcales bacterium]
MQFQRITVLAAAMLFGFTGTASAKEKRADAVRVHVKLCDGALKRVKVESFNGRDDARSTAKEKKQLTGVENSVTLKCRGQGKKRCWIKLTGTAHNGGSDTSTAKVGDGKWLRVKARSGAAANSIVLETSKHDTEPSCAITNQVEVYQGGADVPY